MKLSSLFLILTIPSMPAVAFESSGFVSHKYENSSLFTEISGKSVLQSESNINTFIKKNISDKFLDDSFSFSSNLRTQHLPWNKTPSERNYKYIDLPEQTGNVYFHSTSKDRVGHYFSHNAFTNEHSFGYKDLLMIKSGVFMIIGISIIYVHHQFQSLKVMPWCLLVC